MTTLNTPFGNESFPPFAATLLTLEPRTVPSNAAGAGVVRWLGPVAAAAATAATAAGAGVVGAGGAPVYRLRPPAAVPEEQPLDDFEALLTEAEADPQQAELLAAGRQWVAQAFYQDEHRTLAGLRLAAGLSQRQLGERCGIGQQHISRYESGKHKPSLDTAHQMAHALGVDLDTYFNAWQATVAKSTAVPTP